MASLQLQEMEWHEGERQMHELMHNPELDNPTAPALTPQLANHLQIAPLIAIGVLDKQNRPWTTLLGGEGRLGAAIAPGIIGIRSAVTPKYDPVVEELFGDASVKQVIKAEGKGRMVSGLTLDLETRKRVKLFGRMIAAGIDTAVDEVTDTAHSTVEAQLVLRIEQSLGNCPKYLNKKHIVKATAAPRLLSESAQLSPDAVDLLAKADLFFVSSSHNDEDMDTNHRGGPPGFMRVLSNAAEGAILCWPEYSGNRLYQTLGNLKANPVAGITVPDFETGDMLYLTGTTEVMIGKEASDVLPRSNLVIKLAITAARMVAQALPFRGIPGESSPYNPAVRFAAGEKKHIQTQEVVSLATLVKQSKLTPTISCYRFALDKPAKYTSGQYVTFDFSSLLDVGYSHMRDDDPTSLNDDFVRTFTVSSSPDTRVSGLKENEFEITIRHIGVVTKYMSRFEGSHVSNRAPLEIPVKGFGGDFEVKQAGKGDKILFIAAGIGITPLLPALSTLELDRVRLLWSVRADDLPLVEDVLQRCPSLAGSTRIEDVPQGSPYPAKSTEVSESKMTDSSAPAAYASLAESTKTDDVPKGDPSLAKSTKVFVSKMTDSRALTGAELVQRRMTSEDVLPQENERVYICAATPFRKQVMAWLPDQELIFEDFNF